MSPGSYEYTYKQFEENPPRLTGGKIQPGSRINIRDVPNVTLPDVESEPVKYVMTGIMHLAGKLEQLQFIADDYSRPVDEYNVQGSQTTGSAGETLVSVQPVYDQISEKITSMIVTGPAAGVCQVILGDRYWNLVIPATGIIVVAPIAILLSRSDSRVLTSVTSGDWGLELMGVASERFQS